MREVEASFLPLFSASLSLSLSLPFGDRKNPLQKNGATEEKLEIKAETQAFRFLSSRS